MALLQWKCHDIKAAKAANVAENWNLIKKLTLTLNTTLSTTTKVPALCAAQFSAVIKLSNHDSDGRALAKVSAAIGVTFWYTVKLYGMQWKAALRLVRP